MLRRNGQRRLVRPFVTVLVGVLCAGASAAGVAHAATGPATTTPAATPAPSPPVTGPGGVTIEQGITYQLDNGPPGTPLQPELLDAYLPPEEPGVTPPAVVLVHGGGWAGGTRTVLAPEAQQLAQMGWASFTIDYRLEDDPNQLPWNDELDDVQAAVRFVAANAKRFDLDPARIAMIGASAGGHLVGLVATLGTLDDTTGHDQNAVPGARPIGVFLPNAIPTYVGCAEVNCAARYAAASPLTHVSASTSPMFIANSQEELIPLQQPDEMIAALQKFGVPNQLDILPGELHAQEYAPQVMQPTIDFLQPYLDAPAAKSTSDLGAATGSGSDDRLPWIIAAGAGAALALGLMLVVVARGRRSRA